MVEDREGLPEVRARFDTVTGAAQALSEAELDAPALEGPRKAFAMFEAGREDVREVLVGGQEAPTRLCRRQLPEVARVGGKSFEVREELLRLPKPLRSDVRLDQVRERRSHLRLADPALHDLP